MVVPQADEIWTKSNGQTTQNLDLLDKKPLTMKTILTNRWVH